MSTKVLNPLQIDSLKTIQGLLYQAADLVVQRGSSKGTPQNAFFPDSGITKLHTHKIYPSVKFDVKQASRIAEINENSTDGDIEAKKYTQLSKNRGAPKIVETNPLAYSYLSTYYAEEGGPMLISDTLKSNAAALIQEFENEIGVRIYEDFAKIAWDTLLNTKNTLPVIPDENKIDNVQLGVNDNPFVIAGNVLMSLPKRKPTSIGIMNSTLFQHFLNNDKAINMIKSKHFEDFASMRKYQGEALGQKVPIRVYKDMPMLEGIEFMVLSDSDFPQQYRGKPVMITGSKNTANRTLYGSAKRQDVYGPEAYAPILMNVAFTDAGSIKIFVESNPIMLMPEPDAFNIIQFKTPTVTAGSPAGGAGGNS